MKKNKERKNSRIKSIVMVAVAVSVFVLAPVLRTPESTVFANPNDQRIAELNATIAENKKKLAELNAQSDSLAKRLEQMTLEMANLQAEIDANEAKNVKLKNEIAIAEAKIKENKSLLADSIKKIYVEGDISSLEILASSSSLSDYVDKQEYRDRVKNKITKLTGEVQELKAKSEAQQVEVANLLRDQINMRVDLETRQADANKLLVETQGSEEEYSRRVSQESSEVERLLREQRAVNSSNIQSSNISYVPSNGRANGGYPYDDARYTCWGGGYYDRNGNPQSCADPWGMYKRECVSYAAFRVQQSGRYMPHWGGRGNANRWPSNARAAGIPVDNEPRVGDVAISLGGTYGHAMYVERINDDGTIRVSQYNFGLDGRYSEMDTQKAGKLFIHF